MQKYVAILFLFLFYLPTIVEARPKIGLVLGGGGAAGVSHIGVLKVLEQQGIPIDMIAGNSMGAIVGSLYASGMRAEDIEQVVNRLDWISLFNDNQSRDLQNYRQKQQNAGFFNSLEVGIANRGIKVPSGLIDGQKLMFELRNLLAPVDHIQNFDQLPIPFRAVATDLATGKAITLKNGNLATAVRASMSIPGLFSPVKIGNQLLVDGFVSNNLPVDLAREMGADILIVSSLPPAPVKNLDSAINVALQSMAYLMRKTSTEQLASLTAQDILIQPLTQDISTIEFDKVKQTIPLGEQGARQQLPALRRLAQQLKANADLPRKSPEDIKLITIASIELENSSGLADSILLKKLGMQVGDVFNSEKLRQGLGNIHSLGYFSLVDYQLESLADNQYKLKILTTPETKGNKRLRFGFSLSDNFNGNATYQVGAKHTRKGINRLGGEWSNHAIIGENWRFESELYQPLQNQRELFINPRVWYTERDFALLNNDKQVAEVRARQGGIQLDVGQAIDEVGEKRIGIFYSTTKPQLKTGVVDNVSTERFSSAGIKLSYDIDTQDSHHFPTQGKQLHAEYVRGIELLGNDTQFQRLTLRGRKVWATGKNRWIVQGEIASTLDNETSIVEQPRIGGLGRLSGFNNDQLAGNHTAVVAGIYMRQITELPNLAKVYAGASLEAGNAWQHQDDISSNNLRTSGAAFIGAQTPLGSVYIGLAKTKGFDQQAFFYFGESF